MFGKSLKSEIYSLCIVETTDISPFLEEFELNPAFPAENFSVIKCKNFYIKRKEEEDKDRLKIYQSCVLVEVKTPFCAVQAFYVYDYRLKSLIAREQFAMRDDAIFCWMKHYHMICTSLDSMINCYYDS